MLSVCVRLMYKLYQAQNENVGMDKLKTYSIASACWYFILDIFSTCIVYTLCNYTLNLTNNQICNFKYNYYL